MRKTFLLFVALTLTLAGRALAVDITTPGQVVVGGDVGILQNDLVCSPPSVGVFLNDGSQLLLNGHALDGCAVVASSPSQTDPQRISVRGPGEIRNAGYGVSLRAGVLRIRDVTITNCTHGIIGSGDANDGPSTVRATNVTVTGSEFMGIRATKVKARNVTASDNGLLGTFPGGGIVGWALVSGKDVTANNNGGEGVFTNGRLKLKDSTANGNVYSGALGLRVAISGSTLTGNATTEPGADIVSSYTPVVKTTTCGTSLNTNGLSTWGVCAND
jgi:hypothetical protein